MENYFEALIEAKVALHEETEQLHCSMCEIETCFNVCP